ncbi:hypothetical protein CBR_g318 [Chara braunii]|uniref:Uncharacterized protein n=1 Tax=Chara braunii TaxID=69332 RepID=A0A388JQE3_CHABU|nr:hypothetical protein CBR_g318 [Chara braunii]|eukprot:GBG59988.1 hypothetical protein CBR_g318 [Chara braunii]
MGLTALGGVSGEGEARTIRLWGRVPWGGGELGIVAGIGLCGLLCCERKYERVGSQEAVQEEQVAAGVGWPGAAAVAMAVVVVRGDDCAVENGIVACLCLLLWTMFENGGSLRLCKEEGVGICLLAVCGMSVAAKLLAKGMVEYGALTISCVELHVGSAAARWVLMTASSSPRRGFHLPKMMAQSEKRRFSIRNGACELDAGWTLWRTACGSASITICAWMLGGARQAKGRTFSMSSVCQPELPSKSSCMLIDQAKHVVSVWVVSVAGV